MKSWPEVKNFIHISPRVKQRYMGFNNLKRGDKIVITIGDMVHSTSDFTEIEIEPLSIKTGEIEINEFTVE